MLHSFSGLSDEEARTLISLSMAAHGGKEAFYNLRDVRLRYKARDPRDGRENVSVEKYLFDGERSYGRYEKAELFPSAEEEFFDGKRAFVRGTALWQAERSADLTRRTNYFLFALPFKLEDKGVIPAGLGRKQVEGRDFDVVEITFEGDSRDKYRLFIDPSTRLIERMVLRPLHGAPPQVSVVNVSYSEMSGIQIPVLRSFRPGDWEGKSQGQPYYETEISDLRFLNGYGPGDFRP